MRWSLRRAVWGLRLWRWCRSIFYQANWPGCNSSLKPQRAMSRCWPTRENWMQSDETGQSQTPETFEDRDNSAYRHNVFPAGLVHDGEPADGPDADARGEPAHGHAGDARNQAGHVQPPGGYGGP